MAGINFYKDIKQSIKKHFSFLKDYGFSSFKERQQSYECHFECSNDKVKLDIWFELISSTPVWATINGYYICTMELDNPVIKNLSKQRKKLYREYFEQYLQTNKTIWLKKLDKQYRLYGQKLNDHHLEEIANILKSSDFLLDGEMEQLKNATAFFRTRREEKKNRKKKEEKIYTCTYTFIDGLVAEYEAPSLNEIKKYLRGLNIKSVSDIKVLDWNGKVVSFLIS